jgi:hypothetical protein
MLVTAQPYTARKLNLDYARSPSRLPRLFRLILNRLYHGSLLGDINGKKRWLLSGGRRATGAIFSTPLLQLIGIQIMLPGDGGDRRTRKHSLSDNGSLLVFVPAPPRTA